MQKTNILEMVNRRRGIERRRKPATEDEKPPKPLGRDCYRSELRPRCVRPPTCLKASSLSTSTSSDHNKHIIIIIPIATMVIIAININTSQFPKPLAFGSGNPLKGLHQHHHHQNLLIGDQRARKANQGEEYRAKLAESICHLLSFIFSSLSSSYDCFQQGKLSSNDCFQ